MFLKCLKINFMKKIYIISVILALVTAKASIAQSVDSSFTLHIEGIKLKNALGQEVRLRGVNVASFEWSPYGDQVLTSIDTLFNNWKVNCVRLPLSYEYWLGIPRKWAGDGPTAYQKRIDDVVKKVTAKKGYIILDNHSYMLPNDDQFRFWTSLAAKYKNHPNVIFDLLNEPKDCTWDQWKNGGTIKGVFPQDTAHVTIVSKGMQALLKTVRRTGAKNVIVAGGINWASDLSGVVNGYSLADSAGNGIMYASHIYPWHTNRDVLVGTVIGKVPVLIGEMGQDSTVKAPLGYNSWTNWMLDWIERNNLNVTAWDFHPDAGPVLIKNFKYEPTPWFGVPFKKYLLNPASAIVPLPSPSQNSTEYSKDANLALDGDLKTFTHTKENGTNPWWYYDLGVQKNIQSIEIYNRIDCCKDRLNGYKLFVSDKEFSSTDASVLEKDSSVWTYTGGNMSAKSVDNVTVNKIGRYIRIQLVGTGKVLSLAEVKVNASIVSAIEESSIKFNEFVIFPNPANDYINIYLPKAPSENIVKMYSSLGKEIFVTQMLETELRVPLEGLLDGIYLIQVGTDFKKIQIKR